MKWISEAEQLPEIAQKVLLAHPRQTGEFWDLHVAQLLVRHEGVVPRPIAKGDRWATEYFWDWSNDGRGTVLVTGNSWWARMDEIPLPPGAEHQTIRGFHCIVQPTPVFVGQWREPR